MLDFVKFDEVRDCVELVAGLEAFEPENNVFVSFFELLRLEDSILSLLKGLIQTCQNVSFQFFVEVDLQSSRRLNSDDLVHKVPHVQ